MTNTSNENTIILSEPKQYDSWERQLRHHVNQEFFRDYLDPGTIAPFEPPSRVGPPPNPQAFPKERTYTQELAAYETWTEEAEDPRPIRPIFTLASLTKAGKESFELALKQYQLEQQAWKAYSDTYEYHQAWRIYCYRYTYSGRGCTNNWKL